MTSIKARISVQNNIRLTKTNSGDEEQKEQSSSGDYKDRDTDMNLSASYENLSKCGKQYKTSGFFTPTKNQSYSNPIAFRQYQGRFTQGKSGLEKPAWLLTKFNTENLAQRNSDIYSAPIKFNLTSESDLQESDKLASIKSARSKSSDLSNKENTSRNSQLNSGIGKTALKQLSVPHASTLYDKGSESRSSEIINSNRDSKIEVDTPPMPKTAELKTDQL